jgi:predicted secreted protein
MNNIWYSFREFKNSILFKIIIIIQITIGIVLLYRVNELRSYETNKLKSMEQITENKKVYKFASEYDSIDSFLADQQVPNKFSDFSKSVQERFIVVTTTYGEMSLKSFNGIENFTDMDFKDQNLEDGYSLVKSLQVSPNFFEVFNIKLSKGNFDEFNKFTQLNYSEWNEEYIPIILGDSYKEIFNLNEILKTEYLNCKVVGFIDQNQFFLDKGIYDLTRIKNLNTFIISPISKNIMYSNINNAFLVVENKSLDDFNFVKNHIDDLAEKQNIKLSISDPNKNITDFVKDLQYNANIKLLIIWFIVFFVIIALIVIFTNRVSARQKEFSIHIINGATIKDICIRIILEHVFLVILSIIVSFFYLVKNNVSIITDIITFKPVLFFESALILISIVLLVSLIPIYYVRKYRLSYLIKGE